MISFAYFLPLDNALRSNQPQCPPIGPAAFTADEGLVYLQVWSETEQTSHALAPRHHRN
jgi:hypothetical protein